MVSCTTVRDLLPEHALGVTGQRETVIVERHLAWCAACRKESQDLARAAVTLAYALPSAAEPEDLQPRVVAAVRHVAGRPARTPTGRMRRVGTLVLAAALAVSGLGVGAVVARRSSPDEQTIASSERAKDALLEFVTLIEDYEFVDPETDVFLGVLGPETAGRGRGTAMTIVVPTVEDRAVVMVTGLTDRPARLPYRVEIADGLGNFVEVGTIVDLDPGGEATVATITSRDLTPFVNVLVTDARDRLVLRGTLRERTSVPSPSP